LFWKEKALGEGQHGFYAMLFVIPETVMNNFANICGGKDTSKAKCFWSNLHGTGQVLNYFQKSSCCLRILGAIRVPCSKFHAEDPQI